LRGIEWKWALVWPIVCCVFIFCYSIVEPDHPRLAAVYVPRAISSYYPLTTLASTHAPYMSLSFAIPEICITLAPETATQDVQHAIPLLSSTRLGVPPPTVDCPSRRTLVQRGLRLGSHRLNCAESSIRPTTADAASTRRTFNWARSPLAHVPSSGSLRSQRGHSRARSLNSLAELNDCLKMAGVNTINTSGHTHNRSHYHYHSEPVRKSIDLSVLSNKAFASPTDFASFAL